MLLPAFSSFPTMLSKGLIQSVVGSQDCMVIGVNKGNKKHFLPTTFSTLSKGEIIYSLMFVLWSASEFLPRLLQTFQSPVKRYS